MQDFIAWRLGECELRINTVNTDLAGISHFHAMNSLRTPITPAVRLLVRNAARQLCQRPRQKRAITPAHLQRMFRSMERSDDEKKPKALRNRALVLACFAAGWRGSEILSLLLTDIYFEHGSLYLQLGASKADQDGREGHTVRIHPGLNPITCPVNARREWLAARGSWHGALFCRIAREVPQHKPLQCQSLLKTLKRLLSGIGENPAPFGSHSLRAGMITASAENRADLVAIMQRTGHKNIKTVMKYVRPAQAFKVDPLAGVL